MSFLVQRAAGRNLTLTQIHGAVLRIGRGTNQELRSDNPAVALEHAIIETDAAGYLITDKGSITGTYVNRKPVESARLAKGDVIEIGDLRIEVQLADLAKPLFLRVITARVASIFVEEDEEEAAVAIATPGARVVRAKKIDYVGAYRLTRPWMTKLSATAILLIVALTLIGMLVEPQRQDAFMPGGLSSAHATTRQQGQLVSDRCGACHSPWQSVSSAKCMQCHQQARHADLETNPPECFSCHAEHRGGTQLADIRNDETCRTCHADLERHVSVPRAQLASLRFGQGRYSFDSIAHVRDFGESHPELVYPKDANTLRFNHRLHLGGRGIFNANGRREVLQCATCHALTTVRDKVDPVAVDFEQHCQRCHRLTFDDRYPNEQVPHGGDPTIVYGAVFALSSDARAIVGKSAADVRRILTARKPAAGEQQAFARKAAFVFRDKCSKCHEVRPRGDQLAVTPPVIPTTWLASAGFTHGGHRNIDCESCHKGVRQSVNTSDVLMPRRSDCTTCHSPDAKTSHAGSSCGTCHKSYHLRPQKLVMSASLVQAGMGGLGSGGRMLQGILLAVIVILLLVVLLPVGIALFQRLRPERGPAAAPAPPKAVPPRTPSPDLSTDRVPRQAAAPPPDIAPSAATARVEALRIEPEPEIPGVGATRIDNPPSNGAGTEMVQWNGMLHCTSGALEGQRFIIEDEGFYIGRDPALAKVVIPDSRISKRHVRIVPRDGRVWAIDQGSTNGTFLKEQRITEVQLKRGDTLVLGDNAATFVYQI